MPSSARQTKHNSMDVQDFDGITNVSSKAELLTKLRGSRRDGFGAFQLFGENQTSLEIGFNGDQAFLYFFPDSDGVHAGYEPVGMTPPNCPLTVFVYQTSGEKADGFEIPSEHIVSADIAYSAATEYFEQQALPPSVRWFEL